MADEIDRANEINERVLQAQLAHREYVPEPTGRCLHCDEKVAPGARFCDVGCRDDWEMERRQRLAAGRG